MRTSSFIGLILLVVALVVASTPALLRPAAEGIEWGMIKLDWAPDRRAELERDRKQDEANAAEPTDPRLVFKGHVVEEDGDLRDVAPVAERGSNQRGRLDAGSRRVLMPGQLENQDAFTLPPVTSEDGVLLDATGCPQLDPTTDVTALMADPAIAERYAVKAADADDPEACRAILEARIAATDPERERALPGDRRLAATQLRSDSERLLLEVYRVQLFAEMMGIDEKARQELVAGARAAIAAE